MPPVSAASSSQAATQYGFQQLRIQQAQRAAVQAEQAAQALEAQATQAKKEANQAQESARSLEIQSGQARDQAGRVRQGLAALESASQAGDRLKATAARVSTSSGASSVTTASLAPVSPPPASVGNVSTPNGTAASTVINALGETTGRFVNTTA